MNTSVKRKIEHGFILRKTAGKIAMFFAQRAGAIKPIGFLIKDTGANAVVTSFTTLAADG